ncbi:MAG: pitrilysin family protein [candidate division WOR-3 bacterium]|nr:insulinase family protein [candidate division WOR-3 bacterium]MDW8150753.1 pitrilysin family protein [candidate division WOR-3 bacterium]
MFLMIETLIDVKPIQIKEKSLNNGLRVFVIEEHSSPVASVQVWYKVGSKNEYPGITGSAHLLEHMMFRGTEKIKDYSEIIDQLGGTDNAFTSFDETAYWCEIPSSAVEKVLMMEADRMRNITFNGFEEERNVVIEERRWRTENDQRGALWEALFSTVFWAHPYKNPVIGWRSDLENVSLLQVKEFYEKYYAPNNAYLIVVGDVKAEEIFRLAEKYFGKYEPKEIPKFYTLEPKQKGQRRVEIKKEGFATYIAIAYRTTKSSSPDAPIISLLSDILGGGKTSRLYRSIVHEKQLATSISAFYYGLKDDGMLVIFAILQQGKNIHDLEKAINEEIENLKTNPITNEELKRAKNSTLASFIYSRESVVRIGFQLGDALINTENPNYINEYPKLIQRATIEDINNVINNYLTEDNKSTIIVHPIPPSDIKVYFEGLKKATEMER